MATIAPTPTPNMRLTTYRLLFAVLVVAAIASVVASLVFSLDVGVFAADAAPGDPRTFGTIAIGVVLLTAIATVVAFLFVFLALALIALPLTRWLVRRGMRPMARDVVLLAVAALIAVPLWYVMHSDGSTSEWLFAMYDGVSAIVWVAALRRMEGRDAALAPIKSANVFE